MQIQRGLEMSKMYFSFSEVFHDVSACLSFSSVS